MQHYRVELVPDELLGPMWCDVCEQAKRAAFRLTATGATAGENGEAGALCEGCSEGLAEGAVLTEADLEARRQRRRGSQEP